ncbi:PREDICTED: UV radiation resistance associated protein isoform X1 [Polistes dominula]|uniref:UV radiation resistance associated protein isoform X1 n=2 Tax=Polistes dominula TaxID=743375 RepID=A0ABM1HUJ0_POLDO|nr:PREDICTED: UV radiation resistance associated protein isoform X1 [Polistes dominula]
MEVSETRNLVRDLDLTLQPRIAPRYKTWLPLATQQLRLRSLIQIIGYKLRTNVNSEISWFYYTLHRTTMSSPIYTSELIDNANPRWSSLEVPTLHATGYSSASEIILRLWKRTAMGSNTSDIIVFTWGISFTGLAYIGPKLPNNMEKILKENSIIFYFNGGFFTPAYCFITTPELKRYLRISVNTSEVKDSYTVNKLTSLRSKMQALKQQTNSVEALRKRIASGDNFQTPKYPQSSLNRLFQPRTVNREKKAEILKIRKELEMAKFRTKLLEQERARKMGELRVLNQLHATITEENQDHGSDLMERYRELNKDIERLHEWRQSHIDTRETYIQMSNQLAHRRRQLISELSLIYPIKQDSNGKFTIHDIHLPDSEDLELANDTQVAVALGFVTHTTQMIANFLNIPTRYPIIHYGSRSKIIDHIIENLPDNDRQFPLFAKGKDRLQFHYAVYLLNKNIAQLRWYCGLPTTDLRATLSNLSTLLKMKPNQSHLDNSKRTFSTSSLDTEVGNGKQNVPLTPPIQKIIFEKCHRSSRSMGQLKSIKSSLGSSLDQGLDKPVQPLVLGSQSKRICKSEESAIDDRTLMLARNRSSTSSNETLNCTVLNNTITTNVSDDFLQNNDCVTIDSNIEITIPTSVSKSVNVTDSLEGSVSIRDRSSNSISSCEMALSGSQNDGDESPNEKSTIKREETEQNISSTNHDNVKNIEDNMEDKMKNGEHTNTSHLDNSTSEDYFMHYNVKNDYNFDVLEQTGPFTINSSKERNAKSCLSLDDIIRCTYDETEKNERTNSISSYTEKCHITNKKVLGKQFSSQLRPNEEVGQQSEHWSEENEEDILIKHNAMLNKDSLMATQKSDNTVTDYNCMVEEKMNQCEFQASSDYIDIIRRSSENVYARTEALANKKTSFKVMKPRL